MTELSFAKSFITTLDSRPNKISADHIEDPKTYPARSAFILPKSTGPAIKKRKTNSTAASSLTVTLKSLRNPPLDISIPSQALTTSILELKEALSTQSSIPVKALRILYNKKPVPDSKILKDLLGDTEPEDGKVEFGIMVIGGAAAVVKKADGAASSPGAASEGGDPMEGVIGRGREVLKTDEFWADLKGFLVQRLKDELEGERVHNVFKDAIGKS